MKKRKLWKRALAAAMSAVLLLGSLYFPDNLPMVFASELNEEAVQAEPVAQEDSAARKEAEAPAGTEDAKQGDQEETKPAEEIQQDITEESSPMEKTQEDASEKAEASEKTESETGNQQENPAETESGAGSQQEDPAETESLPTESETYTGTEEDTPAGYCSVLALDGMNYMVPLPDTASEVPLENIIKEDGNGRKMMYVTMRDKENRIVSTTDPSLSVDDYYQDDDTKRVALNQSMTVYLNFASMKEAALPDGVSKDVYYYLDLPWELVPGGKKGQDLVNPDKPIELIHNGAIRAFGGIYANNGDNSDPKKPWRLKLNFADTEDQVEISAGFQYTVAISGELEYDHTYGTVDFGGAGMLSFVTEKDNIVEAGHYNLSIKGSWNDTDSSVIDAESTDTKINWTAILCDNTKGPDGASPSINNTLTFDMPDGHGLVGLRVPAAPEYFSNTCPISIWVTYKGEAESVQLNSKYIDSWVFYDADKMGAADGSFGGKYILKLEPISSYVNGINNNTFITNQLKLVFQDVYMGNSNPTSVKDIAKWEIKFSTQAYDNAGTGGNSENSYTLTGTLDTDPALTATDGLKRSYGSPDVTAFATPSESSLTFGGVPETVTTTVDIRQSDRHAGNYISFEYTPNVKNTLGADYYVSARALAYQKNIGPAASSDQSPDEDVLFKKITIGGEDTTWTHTGSPPSGSYDMFGGGYFDPVLQYQVKKIFSGNPIWVYKCEQTNDNGKNYWMFIEYDLWQAAQACAADSKTGKGNGWWGYSGANNVTEYPSCNWFMIRKPGTWKVHIFNTAGKDVHLEFDEHMGKFSSADEKKDAEIENEVTLSSGEDSKTVSTRWNTANSPIASMKSEYVSGVSMKDGKEYDNLIKWEMEIDFSQFKCLNSTSYSDAYYRIYVKIPKGLDIAREFSIIDGKAQAGDFYYSEAAYAYWPKYEWDRKTGKYIGKWLPRAGQLYEVAGSKDEVWTQAGFNPNDSGAYNLFYFEAGGINPITADYISEGKLRIAFFTQVCEGNQNDEEFGCEAVLHDFSGEMILANGGNALPNFCFEARAKATAPRPTLTKSVEPVLQTDQMDTDLHKTKLHYQLVSDTYSRWSELNGVWAVRDSMGNSVVKNEGTVISGIDPASYTELEELSFKTSSYWFEHTFTKEEIQKAIEDTKEHKVTYTYDTNYDGVKRTMTAELLYSGNMKGGFTLRLRNLEKCSKVTVDYTTALDDARLCKAIDENGHSSVYDVELKNEASRRWMNERDIPKTTTSSTSIVAALAIKKSVGDIPGNWDGVTENYVVKTTIGASPTTYLHITDYISGYQSLENWNNGSTEEAVCDSKEHLAAIARSLKLDPDKITVKVQSPGDEEPQVIFENRKFTEAWKGSSMTVRDGLTNAVTDKFAGALYYLDLKKADGSYIPAGTVVTISYSTRLDMDTKVDGDTTFRESEYYPGGVLKITNNVQGARAYKAIDELPDKTVTVRKARSGQIDTENMELICDAGAVSGKYLQDKDMLKLMTESENGRYKYTIAGRAEQKGKGQPDTVKLTDIMSAFENQENMDKLMKEAGKTEDEAREILEKIDSLFRRNLTISDLKVHFGTAEDKMSENLPVIYEQEGRIVSVRKLVMENTKTVIVKAEDLSKGFSLEVAPADFGDVVVATYYVDIDWPAFHREAQDEQLFKDGKILGIIMPAIKLVNTLKAGEKEFKHSNESSVEILNMTAGKRLVSEDSNAGTASWEVTASTGFTEGNRFVIRDAVDVELPQNVNASVMEAVKAAMSLSNVKLVQKGSESLTLYENGGLTTAGKAAGWKDANVSIKVKGLTIEITLSDQTGETLLDSGQIYVLTYDSILDKDAYLKTLTDKGVTAEEIEKASYILNNTANAECGGLSSSADANVTQKPGFPLDASKTGGPREGEPENMDWSLTADTGDVSRENFEIRDVLTVDSTDPAAVSILNYISLKEMVITFQTGESEAEIIFDYAGQVNLLDKYKGHLEKLSAMDGGAEGDLVFGENGVYGFRLSFGEAVPKNTVVTVSYCTVFGKEAYLEAGGTADRAVDFENTMRVSAAGSKSVTKSGEGSLLITETVSKAGKKVGKTQTGSDILEWSIPVDLRTEYTEDQLRHAKVSVIDNLHAALSYIDGSLAVYKREERNGELVRGHALPENRYSLSQNGNEFAISFDRPDEYPVFEIVIRTEVVASLNGLTNEARLVVDGKSWNEESDPVPDVVAAGQSGFVASMNAPEWRPEVFKNVDGEPCTEADAFGFTLTEVNADGTAIDGAYSDEATNNADGKAIFQTIQYKTPANGEIHYYKIAESACDETKYQKDKKEYLLSVKLTRLTSAYQVTITDMNSGDAANRITFQNATLIDISGKKVWDDENDQDGKRPDHVKIHLLADGVEKAVQEVTAGADGSWSWNFEKLPKTADGITIQYTVTEDKVPDYTTDVTGNAEKGFTVTNSYTPGKTSFHVTKVWKDADDQDGKRPDDIRVKLLADGIDTKKTLTLNEANNWTGDFRDLDEYRNGKRIVYTVEEIVVPNYDSAVTYEADTSSAVIMNVHIPERIGISIRKVWDDKNNEAGKRPDYIELQLLADGAVISTQAVTAGADHSWRWAFTNLPKYKDGKEIIYTVTETKVEDYSTAITGDWANGFTITNTYTPKKPDSPDEPEDENKSDSPDGSGSPNGQKNGAPKTGDSSRQLLWITLLLLSAGGIALIFRKRKRKLNH